MAIFGLVAIALGVWVYGRWTAPGASAGRVRFGYTGLVALLWLVGAWLGWPAQSKFTWEPWSPEAVAKLRAENRIVYVDFTARWCATCQTNKKLVFGSGEVLKTFADKKSRHPPRRLDQQRPAHHRRARRLPTQRRPLQRHLAPRQRRPGAPPRDPHPRHRAWTP
jgi:hypothetical protein